MTNSVLAALQDFKLGAIEGYAALVVVGAIALTVIAVVLVLLINGIKAAKEHSEEKEARTEDAFFAEYGVTGEQMRLNEELSRKRAALRLRRRGVVTEVQPAQTQIVEKLVQVPVEVPVDRIVEVPVEVEKYIEVEVPVEKIVEVPVEKVVEKVVEVEKIVEVPVEAPAPEPTPEPTPAPAPVTTPPPQPVKEQAPTNPNAVAAEASRRKKSAPIDAAPQKQVRKKRDDDWSKYEGDYEGYYYDPEDACYYEGAAPEDLVDKLAAKKAEWEAQQSKGKKTIIKRVKPPFLPLDTPKHERKTPAAVDGFDESVIYGKYVIEHAPGPEGEEYFYTLYTPTGDQIYGSSNYSSLEYCKRAINRFKSHVKTGLFSVGALDGKFYFVLQRKSYVHKGEPVSRFDEVYAIWDKVKTYYGTDIIREQ